MIDLNQKEVKDSKKTVPTEEKIKQEIILCDREQKVCSKKHSKAKYILNKDEINELINIIEECPNTKKEGKKENYRKKDEDYQKKDQILNNKEETLTNMQKKIKIEKQKVHIVLSEKADSNEIEKNLEIYEKVHLNKRFANIN